MTPFSQLHSRITHSLVTKEDPTERLVDFENGFKIKNYTRKKKL